MIWCPRVSAGFVMVVLAMAACAPRAVPAPTPTARPAEAAQPPAADTRAVEDFYRRKTIRLLVGYSAGGPYDIFSRLVAKHLGRFVPGNPAVIVENKPGAASLLAANQVY